MQVDDNLLYRGIENQSSPAYSSLYFSNFLSLLTLNNAIFCNRFHSNHSSLNVHINFGIQTDKDLCLACIYYFFFLSMWNHFIPYYIERDLCWILIFGIHGDNEFSLYAFCNENNTIWFKQLSGGIVGFSDSSSRKIDFMCTRRLNKTLTNDLIKLVMLWTTEARGRIHKTT